VNPVDRWRRIDELCHAALERDASDRPAFLATACAGDQALRAEVEGLLEHAQTAEGFLVTPIGALAADALVASLSASLVGRHVGPYEILSRLGAGGMGEVYRARDTQLGRDVAIKVLPPVFTADPERLTRFEREARLLAALNHPHIGAIYGVEPIDGGRALVLELVEGETLAERLAGGAIAMAAALAMARQIAGALEAAHEKGIVHRDLKPANITITPAGVVKVLDFGLAKVGAAGSERERSQSPTITIGGTQEGLLRGTAAYMSPEQARGQPVDKRTDIWAFGCVLFEMVTGRMAFPGDTVSDHIAAILERAPDWTRLPVATPPDIQRLLRRCLEKDQGRRLHDIADARIELEDVASRDREDTRADRDASAGAMRTWRALAGGSVALTAVLAAMLTVALWGRWRASTSTSGRAPVHFLLSEKVPALTTVALRSFAISPDGQRVVYVAERDGVRRLYLRELRTAEAQPIAGTENAIGPFFSTDSQRIGFSDESRLKVIGIAGGAAVTLAQTPLFRGAAWAPDNTIIFSPDAEGGLWRVSAEGGTRQLLTAPDPNKQERGYRWPEVLPGGDAVIFTAGTSDILSFDDARLMVRSLRTGAQHELLRGGSFATYATSGHLLYARAGALLAAPFDPARGTLTGTPTTVAEGIVTYPLTGAAQYAVSGDGTLVYLPGGSVTPPRVLTWVDRTGRATPVQLPPAPYTNLSIAPDGRLAAVTIDAANASIWLLELDRAALTRLTTEWTNNAPFWTPDGTRVGFSSGRGGVRTLFWQPADGHTGMEPLTSSHFSQHMGSWSPDGRTLAFDQLNPTTGWALWVMSMAGNRRSEPFVQTTFNELSPRFAPSGRWLAYVSDEGAQTDRAVPQSGAQPRLAVHDIYVRPFPGPGRTIRISHDGGDAPVWSRDGREIFYLREHDLMAVKVAPTGDLSPRTPHRLFERATLLPGDPNIGYDVSADGRFLMIDDVPASVASAPIAVVMNWTETLKK
jgi:Tol biopolymer transport system component